MARVRFIFASDVLSTQHISVSRKTGAALPPKKVSRGHSQYSHDRHEHSHPKKSKTNPLVKLLYASH